jgi:hypothetical protein
MNEVNQSIRFALLVCLVGALVFAGCSDPRLVGTPRVIDAGVVDAAMDALPLPKNTILRNAFLHIRYN